MSTRFDALYSELLSVPDDLRNVLEQCLAEDATPENLDLYLPNVRQIITNLLQGLRGKQSIYRRIVSDYRHRSGDTNHQRTDSRTSRTTSGSRGDRHYGSQISRPRTDDERESGSVSRRSGQSSRRRDQVSGQPQSASQQNGNNKGQVPSVADRPIRQESSDTQPSQSSEKPGSQRRSDMTSTETSFSSQASTPPPIEKESRSSSNYEAPPIDQELDNRELAPSPPPPVPPSVKRYSLIDKPASLTPAVVVEPSSPRLNPTGASSPSPPPDTPPIDPPPAVALSLAALKSNDVILERRASKRFSVYNISKITGASTSRERSLRGPSNHVNRRSTAAAPSSSPNDLGVLPEVDDEEAESPPKELASGSRRQHSVPRSVVDHELPQLPGLPTAPEPTYDIGDLSPDQRQSLANSSQITVFLQLGREVKKVRIEPGLAFASLRVLFVDKFSYNPGLDNFPAIYIRDPSSGVQYELENTDEVQDKCLLSLNIERACFLFVCFSGKN